MIKLNNVIGTPVNRDANGFVSVVDEDKKGNHAVPVTLVTKDGEGIFDYLKALGGGGSSEDLQPLIEEINKKIKEIEATVSKQSNDIQTNSGKIKTNTTNNSNTDTKFDKLHNEQQKAIEAVTEGLNQLTQRVAKLEEVSQKE